MRLLGLILAVVLAGTAGAAVFQYQVDAGKGEVSLWIPPEAAKLRGLVVGGMTLAERELVEDDKVRAVCREQGLGIVFSSVGLRQIDLETVLAGFAAQSGYAELTDAPLFFVGHSAGGPQAREMAMKYADRCFGLMLYRGGGPWGGEQEAAGKADPLPPRLPLLMMVGQFDEFGGEMRGADGEERVWGRMVDELQAFRAANPENLASVAVEPGAGHFSWSERNAAYFSLFLKKATERIGTKVKAETGWLTDSRLDVKDRHPAAAYGDYQGDKSKAAWHFDRELADATEAYHSGLRGKRDQFVRWEDPYDVESGVRQFFSKVEWIGDGTEFEVHPVHADKYPPLEKGGPRWLQSGDPVGNSGETIGVRVVSGPVKRVGEHRFRVGFDGLRPAEKPGRITFMAFSKGNAEFRHTEQVGMLPKSFKGFTNGADQDLKFAPLSDMKAGDASQKLDGESSAGLPVNYYVAYGPAVVEDGKVRLAEIPMGARFPIKVKVVAWQFGSGKEPQVKTAEPVARLFEVMGE